MEKLAEKRDLHQEIASHNMSQFLTFELNGDTYGINILRIKEIIDYGGITRVPLMPDYIAGVINLRGSVVPVVDLALRFGHSPVQHGNRSSIIILDIEHQGDAMEVGIIVGMVNEVVDIIPTDIEPAPSFGTKIRTDFIRGMGKSKNQLLVLLATDKVVSIDELSQLNQVSTDD